MRRNELTPQTSRKADIWAIGCIVFELYVRPPSSRCLTPRSVYGRLPFGAERADIEAIVFREGFVMAPPAHRPNGAVVPQVLQRAMSACLAFKAQDRPTAEELLLLLAEADGSRDASAQLDVVGECTAYSSRR